MHKCTNEEFNMFKPAKNEGTATKVNQFHADGHFFCNDWKAMRFALRGTETSGLEYTTFDPMLIPCASKVTLFDGSVIGGGDECVWDEKEVSEYMGTTFNMLAYHNQ